MKAKLVPVYFQKADDTDFVKQVARLKDLLAEDAEILAPVKLGSKLPVDADAAVFPQMLGDAYRHVKEIRAIAIPILVITSEFGTVSMWDWEINNYLNSLGIKVIAPYNLAQARQICKALSLKNELKSAKILVYQDNPGDGMQADIFKRFYWWEDECIRDLEKKFGFKLVKKSFKQMGAQAKAMPDAEAQAAWEKLKSRIPTAGLTERSILSAIKVYLTVKKELDADPSILAAGINCLNESAYSDSTPCLAWNILFEDKRIVWGCEADLVSMVTEVLIHKVLDVPFMMTNLYPFLMGMAALKHEKIAGFPEVKSEPENHLLLAHCGYFGVVPQSFSKEWTLREKVLAIVDNNANAIDARMQEGPVTLVKLMPPFDALSVVEGELETYAQFPGSDCRNGAVVHVTNGHRMMKELASHHYVLTLGRNLAGLETLAVIFGMQCKVLE